MNKGIHKLAEIASKEERKIIGLMSGTSMDGLDIALCNFKGSGNKTQVNVLHFKTVPYDTAFREAVKSVFAKPDADLQQVCMLNAWIGTCHAEMIIETLESWHTPPQDIDLVASHGQTIFHAPKSMHEFNYPDSTLQIGDGDHIAVKTGIITLCDFRQKHIAAGGEGAPLAVYGDYLLFSKFGENRIMLNIGGIANFTFLPGDKDASKVFSTDVGPGNTLMDQYIQLHWPGLYFDKDAAIAGSGKVSGELLQQLLGHPFFKTGFPKTTGPELFNLHYLAGAQKKSNTTALSKADVLATLCKFSAEAIITAVNSCFTASDKPQFFMSGGGMHNSLLVNYLKTGLPHARFNTTADLKINPDAKEAVLFATLANESVAGNAIDFGEKQGVPAVCMGKICLPG